MGFGCVAKIRGSSAKYSVFMPRCGLVYATPGLTEPNEQRRTVREIKKFLDNE